MNTINTSLTQLLKTRHLCVLLFLSIVCPLAAQGQFTTEGSVNLNIKSDFDDQQAPWPGRNGQNLTFSKIDLAFEEVLWLDSIKYCFLTLTLFEERPIDEQPIENLAFYFEQYTESLSGLGLKREGDETFKDPLLYHQYSDSLGDYTQALFLCDDFKVKASDSLMLNITTIGGVPTQSQAFFFNFERPIAMPLEELCAAEKANIKWLKNWLKHNPESKDWVIRRL